MAKYVTHQVVGGNAVLARTDNLSEAISSLEHKIARHLSNSKWVNVEFSSDGEITEVYTISLG